MNAQAETPAAGNKKPDGKSMFWSYSLPRLLNYLVLVLSLGLIAFISWDTYKGTDFLENPVYMKYQFATCMVFLAEYVYRFIISEHKLRFMFLSLPFLFISIPYLNIIEYYGLSVSPEMLRYLCFIPIVRGLVALVMVVTFVTENLTTTVCASYVIVMVPIVYMSGLVFYIAEKDVNTAIKNFWYALWWAGMNVTTIGCDINPITPTGMILGFLLALLGIIMLPLFTVYFGTMIQDYSVKLKQAKK